MTKKKWLELRYNRPKPNEKVNVKRGELQFIARFKPSAFGARVWQHTDGKLQAASPRDLWSRL